MLPVAVRIAVLRISLKRLRARGCCCRAGSPMNRLSVYRLDRPRTMLGDGRTTRDMPAPGFVVEDNVLWISEKIRRWFGMTTALQMFLTFHLHFYQFQERSFTNCKIFFPNASFTFLLLSLTADICSTTAPGNNLYRLLHHANSEVRGIFSMPM